ncbi:MAG: type II toxin-antitoxin system HicB family antitoxin [Dehalococcoidia bacterium]|nr:type II toxin-antitoxin system HicB family antitoxin [Dehalococcoidia bacterium]
MKKALTKMCDYVVRVQVTALEEGGFLATCPDLPGCRAEGRSIPEVLDFISDVAEKVIGLMQVEGLQIPENIRMHRRREALQSEILVSVVGG